MVQGMGIASFACDSIHSIDTSRFSSLNENYEESFDIFVSRIPQSRLNDSFFSYHL